MKKTSLALIVTIMALVFASCSGPGLEKVFDSGFYKIGYNENMMILNDGSQHWIEGNFKIAFGVTSSKMFEINGYDAPPPGLVGFTGEGMKVEKTTIHGLQAMWIEGKFDKTSIFACLYPLEGATVYAYTELLKAPESESDAALARKIIESFEVTSPDLAVAAAKEQAKEEIKLQDKTLNASPGDNYKSEDLETIIEQIQKNTNLRIDGEIKDGKTDNGSDLAKKIIDRSKLIKELTKPVDR